MCALAARGRARERVANGAVEIALESVSKTDRTQAVRCLFAVSVRRQTRRGALRTCGSGATRSTVSVVDELVVAVTAVVVVAVAAAPPDDSVAGVCGDVNGTPGDGSASLAFFAGAVVAGAARFPGGLPTLAA